MLLTCIFHSGFAIFVHVFVIAESIERIPGWLTLELLVGGLSLVTFALWRHPQIRNGKARKLSALYRGVPPLLVTLYACTALYVWGRFIVEHHHLEGSVTGGFDPTHPVMISAWSILLSTIALALTQSGEARHDD